MDSIKDTISKTELSQEEMQYVVEQYIWEKKQKKVTINITNSPLIQMVPPNMTKPLMERELYLLNEAYNVACTYFFEKFRNEKINERNKTTNSE